MAQLTIWAPAIALGVTLPALLVPDGRLRSPRWRVVAVRSPQDGEETSQLAGELGRRFRRGHAQIGSPTW